MENMGTQVTDIALRNCLLPRIKLHYKSSSHTWTAFRLSSYKVLKATKFASLVKFVKKPSFFVGRRFVLALRGLKLKAAF